MRTEIISKFDLSKALACLKRGKPIIFPTETVYGIGAPIFNEKAVQRIFEIKNRPADNPLIAHIGTLDQAKMLSENLCDNFYRLANHFWPGPLTIVVKGNGSVPKLVSAGLETIAIRMPSHLIAKKLIEALKEPIVAPSANLSGRPSATRLSDALEDLDGKVELAIDGGESEIGIESTVISLYHSSPTLLRPGHISKEALEEVLKQRLVVGCSLVCSPGMKYRHYAPKAEVKLVFDIKELDGPFIEPTARTLYQQLRLADRMEKKQVQIYCSIDIQKDEALMNRLLRAAGK